MKKLGLLFIAFTLLVVSSGCMNTTSTADPNEGLDVRKMAADAEHYAITYAPVSQSDIDVLKTYPLVIVHPYSGEITRSQIMQIKQGVDPEDPGDNAVVLCYISIGEDERTFAKTDAEMRSDLRFVGDGTGPSIDPRAPGVKSLTGVDPLGTPTNGGFASYYVNDNAVRCGGSPDKIPDIDINFNTRFVNAGDPKWYDLLNDSIMDTSNHTPPGLKEMLKPGVGRDLGCDGVFLDTLDTAAPNVYTSCSDADRSSSEWTAKGFTDFTQKIRADYPDKVILQNRGLFFFDPRWPHYEVSARGTIDIGFFESYHSGNDELDVSVFFPDNKYIAAPKVMAEANRPVGFKMLSIGYADGFLGPKPGINVDTLLGEGETEGFDLLITDMEEAQEVGLTHYITSAPVDLVNSFVKNNEDLTDTTPPQWSSVYNQYWEYDPIPPPDPRVGVQDAVKVADGSVTLSWDVALDMNKVSYILYYQKTPFDFISDPSLSSATRIALEPSVGEGYSTAWNNDVPSDALKFVYPYQETISNLDVGTPYYFLIRAIDSKGNEDTNQVVLTATP